MKQEKTLVVAFDGLDKDLIEEFGLEHLKQSEFGAIDNTTGISEIMTNELYASFITGETHEEHGIKGLKKDLTPIRNNLIRFLTPQKLVNNIRGFDFIRRNLNKIVKTESRDYFKQDLECDTIFEEVEDSRAMFVPSYNPSMVWAMMGFGKPLKYGYSQEDILKTWDKEEYEYRKRELFSELENPLIEPRSLLMCHFHRPDTHQHFYDDKHENSNIKSQGYDKAKLRKMYKETDNLAKEIKKKALEKGYTTIIFMSDHGRPTEKEHNENAFYSVNKELFGSQIPLITDFKRKISK